MIRSLPEWVDVSAGLPRQVTQMGKPTDRQRPVNYYYGSVSWWLAIELDVAWGWLLPCVAAASAMSAAGPSLPAENKGKV